MAVLTHEARKILAQYIMSRPLYLAIGTGSPDWGEIPDTPDYEATGLINEIGRKKLTRAFFVVKDENGEIDMPGGRRYSYSATPTRQIYLFYMFDYGEGLANSIREIGVFMDTETKAGLPETQTYFIPEEIENQGTLILLEHLETPDTFTPNKKGSYGTILTV
ncbi:MAG: hypothetical protein IJ859_09550 [Synergistaceae bacterium]|nr:hypothetical protein [Synergistaceae bacterium]